MFLWENLIIIVKPIAVKVIKCEKKEESGHDYFYTLNDTKEHERNQTDRKQNLKTEIEEMKHEMKENSVKLVKALSEINQMKIEMTGMKVHIQNEILKSNSNLY